MSQIEIRNMSTADRPALGELIRESTNAWYQANRGFEIFTCGAEEVELFCEVYEDLDPMAGLIAEDTDTKAIAGSCFVHPRETHVSLGIMNVHPDYFGQGIAGELLREIIKLAEAEDKPVRLVSSAMNLDSFSLYNRYGFVPIQVYQDMLLEVPEEGVPELEIEGEIRMGSPDDAARMADLEESVSGIRREEDFAYFLDNKQGIWNVSVLEANGELQGFLVSVAHPASRMLGPGVMRTQDQAAALIHAELNHHKGEQPVWLIPSDRTELVRAMYALGAKNCELHVAQVRGNYKPFDGISMPTFMPETG